MNLKTLVVSIAILSCVGTSYAQGFGGGGGGGRGQGRMMMGGQFGRGGGSLMLLNREDVQKELALTDDQKSKVTSMQQKQRESMMAMFQGGERPDPEKMQEIMKKAQEEQQKEIDGILTAEQKTRLKELSIQRAGNGAVMMPEVEKELAITADQKSKITSLQEKAQEANMSIMEKVRNQELDMQEARTKTEANQKVLDEEIAKILTDAQKEKLKAMQGKPFTFAPDQQRRRGGGGGLN